MKTKDENSYAWSAYNTQGRETPGNEKSNYTGHDSFQNGVIEPKNNSTIYVAEFDPGNNSRSSGYFTDQSTIKSCMDNDGKLNANELGSKCQTMPSNMHRDENGCFVENENGVYRQRPYVNAYDIDFNKLEQLGKSNKSEDKQLYEKLTNPDGKGNDSGGIKCAYGRVEANPQFGLKEYQNGGGNQYYIDRDTFNQAKEKGVLVYNEDKSFSESKGNLNRQDIPYEKGKEMEDKANQNFVITKTPQQVNNEQVKSQYPEGFICQPDKSYGYDNTNTKQTADGKMPTSNKPIDINNHGPPGDSPAGGSSVNTKAKPSEDKTSSGMPTTSQRAEQNPQPSASTDMPTTGAGYNSKPSDAASNDKNTDKTKKNDRNL